MTPSLPTRHTQSRTHPLSIDAWAKGEVFPGEVLKLDGDWARVTGGRTAHETEGTAGWRSDGGGREREKRGVLWLGPWWTCAWSVRRGLDKEGELEQEGLGKG